MPWILTRRWTEAAGVLLVAMLVMWLSGTARAAVAFERAPKATGGLIVSSWVSPEGSDSDEFAYDSFVLDSDRSITEVRWRGGYVYGGTLPNGTKDFASDFRVTFYASIAGDYQPLCGNPHADETVFLADYTAGSNAGETPCGTFGGKAMYDYAFVLPEPFEAKAGTKYWLRVEASQAIFPDWGIAAGIGRAGDDSRHFHFFTGGMRFAWGQNDAAFTLIAPGPDPYTFADVTTALGLCAGTSEATDDAIARLNACIDGESAAVVDMNDALLLARKVSGLEPNP